MQFYKIDMVLKNNKEEESATSQENWNKDGWSISENCQKYADTAGVGGAFFLNRVYKGQYTFGIITREPYDIEMHIKNFAEQEKINYSKLDIKETTFARIRSMLSEAERNEYIYDYCDILQEYDLSDLDSHRNFMISYEEKLILEKEKQSIYMAAERYFAKDTLQPELDRIFTPTNQKRPAGHPVDYIIESNDDRTKDGITNVILQALYSMGRIVNRRYCKVEFENEQRFPKKSFSALYNSCVGGTVVITIKTEGDEGESDKAQGNFCYIEDMCQIVRHYARDVLTVICLPKGCKRLKNRIYDNIGTGAFVEISEEVVFDNKARNYLKDQAKKAEVQPDNGLFTKLEKGHGYLAADLNEMFDQWYCQKLRTDVYSQYKDIVSIKKTLKEKKPVGSAFDEFESMIGLASAKRVLHQVLDSCKAQKLFRDKGMKSENYCNHMVFTGNPGTAKTTVARLFARILKDNGVLSKGHLVETGRGDLVGMYVGWTAPSIQKKFKEASGGVLFIDEAYSLVDDCDGSYGDEAINTIVQEMENHRNDVIVIFAGYPDKMEQFISKNPGLRSRIAHHVNFEDYDTDELVEIAGLIAEQKGLVLEDGAKDKLKILMEEARKQPDFGNGRYVRNIIEKAKMAQGVRLVRMDYDSVTTDDVKRICAEDIEIPEKCTRKEPRRIGFSVA